MEDLRRRIAAVRRPPGELVTDRSQACSCEFPYIAPVTAAAVIVVTFITVHRHPSTGSSEGTTPSDVYEL
jgi:hypothetical protein